MDAFESDFRYLRFQQCKLSPYVGAADVRTQWAIKYCSCALRIGQLHMCQVFPRAVRLRIGALWECGELGIDRYGSFRLLGATARKGRDQALADLANKSGVTILLRKSRPLMKPF